MKANLIQILKNLVQIPTENPPGITDEIVDYLISEVFKESDGFHNEVMNYKKKKVELKNLITKIGNGKEKINKFQCNINEVYKKQLDYFFTQYQVKNYNIMNNFFEASKTFKKIINFKEEKCLV